MDSYGSDWTRGTTVPDKGSPRSMFSISLTGAKVLMGPLHMEKLPKQQQQQQTLKTGALEHWVFAEVEENEKGIKKAPPLEKGQEYTPDPEL